MAYSLPIAGYYQSPVSTVSPALLLLQQLVGQASSGQSEAKQANEDRYNDILNLIANNKTDTLANLQNFGTSLIDDANTNYKNKRNELLTDLADRGLGGSTKRIAVEDATQREKDAAVNRINDMLNQQKIDANNRYTDNTTGVMERRSDPYPDTSNIGSIIGQLMPLIAGSMGGGNPFGQQQYFNGSGALAAPAPSYGIQAPIAVAPRQSIAGLQQTPASQAAQMAAQIAAINAQNAQDSAYANEQKRRNGMIALRDAEKVGGMSNVVATNQALNYLQNMGFANWNPIAETKALVDTSSRSQPSYTAPNNYGGGYYQPSYSSQASTAATNQRIAGYARDRQDYMNLPSNAMRQQANDQNTEDWLASVGAVPSRGATPTQQQYVGGGFGPGFLGGAIGLISNYLGL